MRALLQKAWLETQTRMLACAAVMALVSLGAVMSRGFHVAGPGMAATRYVQYIDRSVYASGARVAFIISVVLLAVGGLWEESNRGSVGFTLALPVRPWWLTTVRAAVGVAQMCALATIPAIVVPLASAAVGQSYPVGQALVFLLLWTAGYTILFAVAFLLSVAVRDQYVAIMGAMVLFILHAVVAALPSLRVYRLNLQWLTSGYRMPYFDEISGLITGPVPWMRLLVIVLLAAGILAIAIAHAESREY